MTLLNRIGGPGSPGQSYLDRYHHDRPPCALCDGDGDVVNPAQGVAATPGTCRGEQAEAAIAEHIEARRAGAAGSGGELAARAPRYGLSGARMRARPP
jgi:hypothetical protein